jgi:protein arginine N-methyltransferase 5
MDNYGAADDPGVTFCIGHHEPTRTLMVTPQVVSRAHESNVSSPATFDINCFFNG